MNPFKNRAVQITMVKTAEPSTTAPTADTSSMDPEQIAQIATEFTVKTIGAIGAVIAGHKVLSTICEIAVVAAKAKIK